MDKLDLLIEQITGKLVGNNAKNVNEDDENATDKSDYHKKFEKKLKDWGVDSPDDLSEEDKKEFFDDLDREHQNTDEKKGIY